MKSLSPRGFTLIELLVVIAIIAVLSVIVILTLNPAELLRQARDSTRISDFATLKSAISVYLVDVASPNIVSSTGTCYESLAATTSCPWFLGVPSTTAIATTSRANNGTGWIPINFTSISSGPPIGNLPLDPVNTSSGSKFYSYTATTTSNGFKMVVNMESIKYSSSGSLDVESTDGGTSSSIFEAGTGLSL